MHLLLGRADIVRPAAGAHVEPRNGSSSSTRGNMIAGVSIGGLFVVTVLTWLILRQVRVRQSNPKYLPGAFLKQKWRDWTPSSLKTKRGTADASTLEMTQNRSGQTAGLSLDERQNRHTSVRSIASLPAYSSAPRAEEEVIAREGERGGIDTVVEFPETVEEEEARRDAEMEALYQIRLVRQEERARREDLRQQRHAARERGDLRALEELRRERLVAQAAAANGSAEDLMRDYQAKERGRRVSSVSYAELGVARHDGSRVRADSNDSDHRPLLDSAARPGMRSRAGSSALSMHLRNQSTLSVATRALTCDVSDDDEGRGGSSEFEVVTWDSRRPSTTSSAARSVAPDHEAASGDIGSAAAIPPPPQYQGAGWPLAEPLDEAPPYESPTNGQAPPLAPLSQLPSIQITPFSPILPDDEDTSERTARTESREAR